MTIKKIAAVAGATMLGLAANAATCTDVAYITTSTDKKNWVLLERKPDGDTIIEATVEVPAAALAQNHTVFCARGSSANQSTFTFFLAYNAPKTQFRWDYSTWGTGTAAGEVAGDTKYVITCNVASETEGKRGYSISGGEYEHELFGAYPPLEGFTAGNQLVLFASYMGSTSLAPVASANYSTFKVYGVRIWSGEQTEANLLFDLRPCMDETGVYCLRDAKHPDHEPYYSKGGNAFGGPLGELKVSVEDFDTCVPHVTLKDMDASVVTSVEFQSARTAEGPWTTLTTVGSIEGETVWADNDAALVGVPLYYRAVINDDKKMVLKVGPFARFRRLERDPDDEAGGLVSGCTQILEQYTESKYIFPERMPWAFDGKTETWPEVTVKGDGGTVADRAKIGVDFGEAGVFFAGGRVFPREGATISQSAYFSASNDSSFDDAVTVSEKADFNGQTDWRFLPSADTVHPYRYVWLWKTSGNWHGNMAEVRFYGWTQQDVDGAGLVVPPQEVTATRGTAAGSVVVGWSGGANIASFDIERRTGAGAWEPVASELPASATSWTNSLLETGMTYEYRIVATGIHGDSMMSPSASTYLYAVGNGTGLCAVLHGPIASSSYGQKSAGQCAYREFRTDATIDINTVLKPLYAQTNLASALVHWRGKLIVPEDGKYTLGLESKSDDGYALWIDGEEVVNRSNCQAAKGRFSMSLESGEHPIRVEWASRANANVRFCRLTWELEGKFPEEVVPMSQLVPETDEAAFPRYAVDGYTFALPIDYRTDTYMPRMERTKEGDYTIYCRNFPVNQDEPDIGRTMDGPFRAEATFVVSDSTRSPLPQLMVRGIADGRAAIGFVCAGGTGNVSVKAADPAYKAMNDVIDEIKACASPVRLRIDRDKDKTLHFYYRGANQAKWTECFTFVEGSYYVKDGVKVTDRATLTEDSLRVSFGAAGGVGTSYNSIDCHVHGFKVQPRHAGMMILVY